ncbi:MAG: hypothetical protein M1827_007487 [Pycnora praestabilis]|nr:MAG: hypothetical protein M1827_007487 [Pycnora praestabilis]
MCISGYNTSNAIVVLPQIIPLPSAGKIRFMTLWFGANDACLPSAETGQHVPLPKYRDNLIAILTHPTIRAHSPNLILITPPPVDEYGLEESDRLRGIKHVMRTAEHTKLYADATREVGEELGPAVLDLWTVIMRLAGWKQGDALVGSKHVPRSPVLRSLLRDGVHFNGDAYKILYTKMMETIEKEWPDQLPEKLPYLLPRWTVAPK